MRLIILATLFLIPLIGMASFPIDNNIISANNDQEFIGGITILFVGFFIYALIWALIILISLILLRFLIYKVTPLESLKDLNDIKKKLIFW
tara:strand:- start:236 stop:508 length:273 start_codon:yes stop_codon:yes gene_type:complete